MLTHAFGSPCFLVVDDSPLSLKWLVRILQSIGPCEIVEANDGVDAIDKLSSEGERIDLVISDLRMPKMNGLQLLKEVRMARTGGMQSIPFFIVTGFAERSLAGLALGLDVDAFLARPPKKQALDRHIIRTYGERRPAKTPTEAAAAYGDVDLTLAMLPDAGIAADPGIPPMAEAIPQHGSVVVLEERLVPLENITDGALLARDAVNGAGAVLLKAGERMTPNLKAVLLSYAEIDEALAKVWISN